MDNIQLYFGYKGNPLIYQVKKGVKSIRSHDFTQK